MYIDKTDFHIETDYFKEVGAGEVFYALGEFFMRLDHSYMIEDLSYNTIALDGARLTYFSDNAPVVLVNDRLIVENA